MTWETVPFTQAFIDVTSKSPRVKQSQFSSVGTYPVRDQGESDVAGFWDEPSAVTRVDRPLILFGDHSRRVKYAAEDFVVGADGVKVLAPIHGLDSRFAYHWMRALNLPSAGYSRHYKFLRAHRVPLPPLAEQRRIAAILDEADAARTLRVRAVGASRLLTEHTASSLARHATARIVSLDGIAKVSSGITKGRKLPKEPVKAVPYLTVANVQDKALDLSTVKEIDVSSKEIERYLLRAGDLLLTEGGDPDKLGRGVVWNEELAEAIHQNHVFRVRPNQSMVEPTWLSWEVGSAYGKRYFLRQAKQTTGIATINSTQLRAFPVRLVDLPAQRRFVQVIHALQAETTRQLTQLNGANELFASLQHRAFRGEL